MTKLTSETNEVGPMFLRGFQASVHDNMFESEEKFKDSMELENYIKVIDNI